MFTINMNPNKLFVNKTNVKIIFVLLVKINSQREMYLRSFTNRIECDAILAVWFEMQLMHEARGWSNKIT